MSTILKALRRIEEEKQARALERDLREAVAQPTDRRGATRSRRARGVLIVAGVVVLAALATGTGWWLGWNRGVAAPVAEVEAPAPIDPRTEPAAVPPRAAAAPPLPSREPAPRRAAPATAPPPRTAVSAPPPMAESAPPAAAPSVEPPVPDESPVAAPRSVATGRAEVVQLDRVDASSVRVRSTVWHPIAERRSAVIEVEGEGGARDRREGDAVGRFELVEIQPGGVVLSRNGVLVKRGVGER